jgi:hypothetical protein
MPRVKTGYKKIMGEIPVETYEVIKAYNSFSLKPFNMSRAIELCLNNEIKKIQQEGLDYLRNEQKKNKSREGFDSFYSDEHYRQSVLDIEDGVSVQDLYERYVNAFYDMHNQTGWLKVVTANRMEHNKEMKVIVFYIDDLCIFTVENKVF